MRYAISWHESRKFCLQLINMGLPAIQKKNGVTYPKECPNSVCKAKPLKFPFLCCVLKVFSSIYESTDIHMRAPADILFSDHCVIWFWNEHVNQWSLYTYKGREKVEVLNITVPRYCFILSYSKTKKKKVFGFPCIPAFNRYLKIKLIYNYYMII